MVKIIKAIAKYLCRLSAVWIIGLFLLSLDFTGGVESLFPGLVVPNWVYKFLFIMSFVIANIYLFVFHELWIGGSGGKKPDRQGPARQVQSAERGICLP